MRRPALCLISPCAPYCHVTGLLVRDVIRPELISWCHCSKVVLQQHIGMACSSVCAAAQKSCSVMPQGHVQLTHMLTVKVTQA